MNKNYYAVIMAGGVGSRFWPLSTQGYPKQFHDLLGSGQTLIQKTFSRLNRFIPKENILVLTNERYKELVLEQLVDVKEDQVILEPARRNTAPCVLYASLKILKKNPNALMLVAPSDHWIEDEFTFEKNIKRCFEECAQKEILMTLGVKPTFPNTGYGYIEFKKKSGVEIKKVRQFREKPDYETAKIFLTKGNFLWNAGIFVWGVRSIVNAFQKFQPELYTLFAQGMQVYNSDNESDFIAENYEKAQDISIDYAILEHAKNIHVLLAGFDWNDLGTWGSLYNELEKDGNQNAILNAKTLLTNSNRNIIKTGPGKIVVMEGLNDYIVVDKDNILLVYPKEKEQDIKTVLVSVKQKLGDHLI
ncbi:mannose-1-phosphate guanylyltransferase [Zhouia amylolytica]|uniref:mannose-1-phosphate guanylyltransferase n=1 Tax=Zhouia amylolytica TaxID=376730 RepID=A0A1I6VT75_9FLAO|nr:mannose-1-phosphate guanylyltransferase [Zhouia amylolytica]MCQ0112586.1 mannose-1-phosphate guanylyltransferase [Zhouia amylolytica]SFT16897.1 mannose-1-phosphate guanylyltransferase [Zhouia amylolytica]